MGQQASSKPVFPSEIAPYIDVAAYLLDSRAPASTMYLDRLVLGKELFILNRSDQGDPRLNKRWRQFIKEQGYECICTDSATGAGFTEVLDYLAQLLKRKSRVAAQRGIISATLRVVVLGVPNVGKSTFLNRLMGKKKLKTGDRPGITRGRQWVRLFEDVEVLDTPGILRDPKLLNRRKPYWMLLNLMPYDHAYREMTIELLIEKLGDKNRQKLYKFYKIDGEKHPCGDWLELLERVAVSRGFRAHTDEGIDRAARRVFKDFQQGRFGRITLEPPDPGLITSPYFRNFGKENP